MVWKLGSNSRGEGGMGGKSLAGVGACTAEGAWLARGVASRCRGLGVGALSCEGGMHEVSLNFVLIPMFKNICNYVVCE